MIPLLLAALGVAALALAEIVARLVGPSYLVGRTLASAPESSIEDALADAAAGRQRYVKLHGRISSDEEFPDENDRPLVYRRKRVELKDAAGRWRVAAAEVEGVPFGVESRSSYVAVDSSRLADGLIVVPRESTGTAADLPAALAAELGADIGAARTADVPARLIVEQLSAVEHAWVAGVPRALDGSVVMTAGRRRPLIVTTLEIPAALRLLGGGRRGVVVGLALLPWAGVALLVAAAVSVALGLR